MSESRQAWRRGVSLHRNVALDNLRNAEVGMTNLVGIIALSDPRHAELDEIKNTVERLRKRLLRINLPLTEETS